MPNDRTSLQAVKRIPIWGNENGLICIACTCLMTLALSTGGDMKKNRTQNEKRKVIKALADMSAALKQSLAVAESAVSALAETKALLYQSTALAEQWRKLFESEHSRPVWLVYVNGKD
jgi:hypothetical protein